MVSRRLNSNPFGFDHWTDGSSGRSLASGHAATLPDARDGEGCSDIPASAGGARAEEHAQRTGSAIASEIGPPLDRDLRLISWILESPGHVAPMVMWSDGQSEIDLADVASGNV